MMQKEDEPDRGPLVRIPLRLATADADRLRDLAHTQRLAPAVLARAAVLAFLERGAELLPRVPPATADLPREVRSLLQILSHLGSNLFQLAAHARERGQELGVTADTAALVAAEIERVREASRSLGLMAREGGVQSQQAEELVEALNEPGDDLNRIARACNTGNLVPMAEWSPPLKAVRAALEPA